MLKFEGIHRQTWEAYVDPTVMRRQIRGFKLQEFATFTT